MVRLGRKETEARFLFFSSHKTTNKLLKMLYCGWALRNTFALHDKCRRSTYVLIVAIKHAQIVCVCVHLFSSLLPRQQSSLVRSFIDYYRSTRRRNIPKCDGIPSRESILHLHLSPTSAYTTQIYILFFLEKSSRTNGAFLVWSTARTNTTLSTLCYGF